MTLINNTPQEVLVVAGEDGPSVDKQARDDVVLMDDDDTVVTTNTHRLTRSFRASKTIMSSSNDSTERVLLSIFLLLSFLSAVEHRFKFFLV